MNSTVRNKFANQINTSRSLQAFLSAVLTPLLLSEIYKSLLIRIVAHVVCNSNS